MAEPSQAKRFARELGKGAYKAGKAAGKKAGRLLLKVLKWLCPVWGGYFLLILMSIGIIGAVLGGNSQQELEPEQISEAVESYRQMVLKYTEENGISEYINVLLAIMQQESAGEGTDVMQSSESPFNERYPQTPGSIKEPEYSIEVGVRHFAECLKIAGCESPEDSEHLNLAIQGYNFGTGYITWALERDGTYTQENALAFSEMKAQELGWDRYGDPYYVSKVLRYHTSETVDMDAEYIYPMPDHTYISDPFGMRDMEGRPTQMHYGVDFPAPEGTPILAIADGTVVQSNFSTGGYGYRVKIKHASNFISHYAHCSKLLVSEGDYVKKGDVIALVGSTGDSTGNHLHLEMMSLNGQLFDPMKYIGK